MSKKKREKRSYNPRPGSNKPGRPPKKDQTKVKVRANASVERRVLEDINAFAAEMGAPPTAIAGDCLRRYFGAYKGQVRRGKFKLEDKTTKGAA